MKHNPFILALAAFLLALAFSGPANAVETSGQAVEGIAIVVNDDVISRSDLEKRLRLALAATGLPDAPESYARLRPQIVQNLIDEKLQMQEAARNNIQVSDAEINEGFAQIAQQNGLSPEAFRDGLKSKNVDLHSLENQIRAQIAWSQVIRRKLRPQVSISEGDIDAELELIDSNAGKPEYLVAEIFLDVPSPDKDESTKALADQLIKQLVEGASFGDIAKQFSQSAGAATGGNLGWVREGQLQTELDQVLSHLEKGQISPAVRTVSGYHILFLRDKRVSAGLHAQGAAPSAAGLSGEATPQLKRLILPLEKDTNEVIVKAIEARAERLANTLSGCAAMDAEIEKSESPASGSVSDAASLPSDVQLALTGLASGQASKPVRVEDGVAIFMNCGGTTAEETPAADMSVASLPATPTAVPEQLRDNIANRLGLERLDMLQRRYLNDLRATAYIDRRI